MGGDIGAEACLSRGASATQLWRKHRCRDSPCAPAAQSHAACRACGWSPDEVRSTPALRRGALAGLLAREHLATETPVCPEHVVFPPFHKEFHFPVVPIDRQGNGPQLPRLRWQVLPPPPWPGQGCSGAQAVSLQGERAAEPGGQDLRPAHLRGPAGPEVLQRHRQLPAGRDPVPVSRREGRDGPRVPHAPSLAWLSACPPAG